MPDSLAELPQAETPSACNLLDPGLDLVLYHARSKRAPCGPWYKHFSC